MSSAPRRNLRLRWLLLFILAAAWLGLAHSDSIVRHLVAVALLQQNSQGGATGHVFTTIQVSPPEAAIGQRVQIFPQPAPSPPPKPAPLIGPALCTGAAVVPSVRFARDATRQLLTVEFRNRGSESCRLGPSVRVGGSNISDQSGTLKMPLCHECGTVPAPSLKPVTLDPGQATTLQLDWPLEATAAAGTCRDAGSFWVGIDTGDRETPGPGAEFRLNAGTLRLCPPIDYGSFQPVDDGAATLLPVRLTLSADQPDYYPDEFMQLKLVAEDPAHFLADSLKSCADLLLLTELRQPEGPTQFTSIAVKGAGTSPHLAASRPRHSSQQELVLSETAKFPAEISYFSGTGLTAEHEVSYVSTCGGWQTLARSSRIETHLAETPLPAPKWGPPADGFALALAAEREAYPLGQDVPLHIACTRFDRDWAISGSTEVPICPVQLEAVDAAGNKVLGASTDFFIRTSHGCSGTRHVEGDAVVEWQSSLATEGHLPPLPGIYHVTAAWEAHDDDDPEAKPVLVHSAPLTVTITGKPQ
jgi:hypothetical protein